MKCKIVFFFICLAMVAAAFAQTAVVSKDRKLLPGVRDANGIAYDANGRIDFNKSKLDGNSVIISCRDMNDKVLAGKCTYVDISVFASIYRKYSAHPDLERETKIARDWFIGTARILDALSATGKKADPVLAQLPAEQFKQQVEKCKQDYKVLLKQLDDFTKKPVKIK